MKTIKCERFNNLDLLKVISIYFVILIHNFYVDVDYIVNNNVETYLSAFIRLFIEGVLIFVFVNGFLLLGKKLNFSKHLKKILKIFLLIIIWSLIYIVVFSLIYDNDISFRHIISNILVTNINNSYTGILWFLQNLICLYLIYPILKFCYDNNKKIYNYLFLLVIFYSVGFNFIILLLQYLSYYLGMNNVCDWVISFLSSYSPFDDNLYFLLYFMVGGFVKDNLEFFKKYRLYIIVCGILSCFIIFFYGVFYSNMLGYFYSSNFNYNTIFLLFFVLGLFALTMSYSGNNKIFSKLITYMGKNSLGIYFLHIIVSRVLALYISFNSLIITLLYGILILLICTVLLLIFEKIPYIKKLFTI